MIVSQLGRWVRVRTVGERVNSALDSVWSEGKGSHFLFFFFFLSYFVACLLVSPFAHGEMSCNLHRVERMLGRQSGSMVQSLKGIRRCRSNVDGRRRNRIEVKGKGVSCCFAVGDPWTDCCCYGAI